MKKIVFNFFILMTFFFIFSCNFQDKVYEEDKKEIGKEISDKFIAEETGEALVNKENGAIAEVNDLLNIFADDKVTTERTVIISTENGELNGFTWDGESLSYKRSGSNLAITTENFEGTILSFAAEVWFYESEDGTGKSVNLNIGKENIKSMKYSRDITANVTHTERNITKDVVINLDFVVTGINDGIEGFFITGTRSSDVHAENVDYSGNWTMTHIFEDVNATREKDGNTVFETFEGSAEVIFNGTYTGPKGTITVYKEAVIGFNRERTVTYTIDGTTITINIVTSEISD